MPEYSPLSTSADLSAPAITAAWEQMGKPFYPLTLHVTQADFDKYGPWKSFIDGELTEGKKDGSKVIIDPDLAPGEWYLESETYDRRVGCQAP